MSKVLVLAWLHVPVFVSECVLTHALVVPVVVPAAKDVQEGVTKTVEVIVIARVAVVRLVAEDVLVVVPDVGMALVCKKQERGDYNGMLTGM